MTHPQWQIDHIKEHQAAFNDLHTFYRDVDEYFAEYSHIPDLYWRLCTDLELEPRPSPELVAEAAAEAVTRDQMRDEYERDRIADMIRELEGLGYTVAKGV